MEFIEIDKSIKQGKWNMHKLHSHTHYEIYFLMEGTRAFFLTNSFYTISAPAIIIIKPNTLHKTEGGPFKRYNINVSPLYLNAFQKNTLNKKALQVITPSTKEKQVFLDIFNQMESVDKNDSYYNEIVNSLFSYIVYLLSVSKNQNLSPKASSNKRTPPIILKIIDYIQSNYAQHITITTLAKKFYMSQGAITYNFKKYTNYNLIDFLLNIRLIKAKELLITTNLSINDISEKCGFSSANYFGLIFKKKEGISPKNYQKVQRSKI